MVKPSQTEYTRNILSILSMKSLPSWAMILGIIVIIALFFMRSYNTFIEAEVAVDSAWANVETQYQRRFDLIPDLVSTVQGAADFESSTFLEVTQARTKWLNASTPEAQLEAAQETDAALNRLLVTVENYPQLQATQRFGELMAQLEGTENRIAEARRQYNAAVGQYNIMIKRFPGRLMAALFGFDERDMFSAQDGAETSPKVEFNFGDSETTGTIPVAAPAQ